MSKIDEQIKKLKERERQLGLEKCKIEFLNHILESAKNYDHEDFKEVKDDVVSMLAAFIERATSSIEEGDPIQVEPAVQVNSPYGSPTLDAAPVSPSNPPQTPKRKPQVEDVNTKLSFAMENRHLSGKKVSVANDKNMTIHGQVVGLDAPYVIVKTDTGPTIKVPLKELSLL